MTTARRPYAPRLPRDERRAQLLDAALEIVAEEGVPAVSIEAIARRAGITRPVVYSVFADLDELMNALFEREQKRAFKQLVSALPAMPGQRTTTADPDEVAVDGLTTFFRAVADNPLTWRLMLLPAEGTPRSLRDRVERTRGQLLEQVEALVEWGVRTRGGPESVEIELLARSLLTLAEEGGRLVLTRPDEFPPERMSAFAQQLLAKLARD